MRTLIESLLFLAGIAMYIFWRTRRDQVFFLRLVSPTPRRPTPKSARVPGSGTLRAVNVTPSIP